MNKRHNIAKVTRTPRSRLAEVVSKHKGAFSRIYVQKHSSAMAFLYETELSEIEAMIEVAEKVGSKTGQKKSQAKD